MLLLLLVQKVGKGPFSRKDKVMAFEAGPQEPKRICEHCSGHTVITPKLI
jgi:hypothetical protein